MKPPPFSYHAPTTLTEALEALAEVGDEGKVLAGGQSLVPLMNMRLASPRHLVDVTRVEGLDAITVDEHGVRIGAAVRQVQVERHGQARAACPLLGQALALVAHPVIRSRGTVCGSVAHADPAAELPAALALLDGRVHLARAGADGAPERRSLAAADFLLGPLETALRPGELVEAVTLPRPSATSGSAFEEVARRHGDYALCGVAALVDLDDGGCVSAARVALVSVGPVPVVVDLAATVGDAAPEAGAWEAAAAQVRAVVEPEDDIHADAGYRRHLAGVLTVRALARAAARAGGRRVHGDEETR